MSNRCPFVSALACMQESSLFDNMGGTSPEPSPNFEGTGPDMSLSSPVHTRYASAAEHGQSGLQSQLALPELQPSSLPGWSQSSGRGMLEQMGQAFKPQAGPDQTQALSNPSSLLYDDRLWARSGPQQQLQQQQEPTTRHQPHQ